ncbi:MAG: RelA/SpoT family protein [Dysgonamonadaceae bacterium]
MENHIQFSPEEKKLFFSKYRKLLHALEKQVSKSDLQKVKMLVKQGIESGQYDHAENKGNILLLNIEVALILIEELGLGATTIIALFLYRIVNGGLCRLEEIRKEFDNDVADIIKGLIKVNDLEKKESSLSSEHYLKLLLTFAEDIRVVMVKIASRLYLMRCAKEYDSDFTLKLSTEASYLYAPLAHKLGLYKIKSEFEDLSLKYTDWETYDFISRKINESKESRDRYVAEFIRPIEEKLRETGLKYDIKGRTKSIFSINNKLKKQKIEFENIYDLFAIRIILDADLPKEKSECWQVYSIVTDLYQPNPKRLKDWLSIPKSNGYESLHITVMGPLSRWVEVQIRTRRMDEIAERGLAAHWKYKGVRNQSGVDEWLANLRETLENKDVNASEKLEDFKLELADDEIFVFTPKGDLHRLPKGASILDFAFSIHSKLGASCVGGKVNGKHVTIKHKLNSGDQIEIITSPNQSPKQDWLNFVVTTKARNKIRQHLKEEASKQSDLAKEQLKRRMKNRKIDADEGVLMRLIKKMGFKTVTDFYVEIANEDLDVNNVIDQYLELEKKENEVREKTEVTSAENFVIQPSDNHKEDKAADELVIDNNLTGVEYQLAKCCNPIFGDEVFAFVSSQGIKIHKKNCPNAHDMFTRFGYRVIAARWSGESGSMYTITLRVLGHDDIAIVTNMTSIISKEPNVMLRSISIQSNDGLFQGTLSVNLRNTDALKGLIKKLKTIKGVKEITRVS